MMAAALLVLLTGAVAGFGVVALSTLARASLGAPVSPADALVAVCAAVGALGCLWLALGLVLEALARVPGAVGRLAATVSAAVTPRAVRRAAALCLGASALTGVAAGGAAADPLRATVTAVQEAAVTVAPDPGWSAIAATPAPAPDPGWSAPAAPTPDPGWVPDRPVVRAQPDVGVVAAAARRHAPDERVEVVVRRGDTLWSLAARHLGPGASDAEVARAWPQWYAANREAIGADPDLLLPGQVLLAPTPTGVPR